jgi:CTP:molybdopterin cytidylyltransferase MocA
MGVLGVVLAAGAGRRFEQSGGIGPKQLAKIAGEPMLTRVLRTAQAALLDDVVLVQGAVRLTDDVPVGVTVLDNRRWPEGLATSLRVAVAFARERAHTAIVVGLADQPGVTAAAWAAVAAAPRDPPIAVATYDGRPGNPVRLAAAVWELLPITGDEGARIVIRDRPDLVQQIPCDGDPTDIDELDDLARWR